MPERLDDRSYVGEKRHGGRTMLDHLRLRNVGPAPDMELAYGRSVNLLTGDNGLGKTFLVDAAWWALTGHWPHDVNPRLTVGFPARPGDVEASAEIECRVRSSEHERKITAGWSRVQERWLRSSAGEESLVVYAHADGSMSVWDPLRNYLGGLENSIPPGMEKRNLRGVDQWPAYVFSESEVWDGLWEESQGRRVPACNGLLFDWSSWIKDRDQSNADAMQAALEALSPAGGDSLRVGPVQRLSIQDSRDIPTILTAYAGAVPILHCRCRRAARVRLGVRSHVGMEGTSARGKPFRRKGDRQRRHAVR